MLQPRGALQTSRTARRKDTVCIRTCKRAMPGRRGDEAIVTLLHGFCTEPAGKCGLVRHRAVSAAKPLDSFPASAQDRSCTNKITGCAPEREISAQPDLRRLRRSAFRPSPAREFVDVDRH